MRLVFGCDEQVAAWMSDRLHTTFTAPYAAIGVVDGGGKVIGGVLFNDYNGANIEATIYGPRAVSRQAMRGVFDYVFRQLGCIRLTARTRRSNSTLRELLPRMGFKFECTQPRYYGPTKNDDAFVYRMFSTACPWMTPGENAKSAANS